MKKIILFYCSFSVFILAQSGAKAQAVLFKQSMAGSTLNPEDLTQFVDATGIDPNKFTGIGEIYTGGSSASWRTDLGGSMQMGFDRFLPPIYFARTTDMTTPATNTAMFQFDATVVPVSSGVSGISDNAFSFFVGSNFADDTLKPVTGNIYSKFNISVHHDTLIVDNKRFNPFLLAETGYTGYNTVRFYLVLNNNPTTLHYTTANDAISPDIQSLYGSLIPTNIIGTVASDTYDLWAVHIKGMGPNGVGGSIVQTVQIYDDEAVVTPTQFITDFKGRLQGKNGLKIDMFFNRFIVRAVEAALPTTFISFKGSLNDNGSIALDWATVKEENLLGFDIERSADAVFFTKISSNDAKNSSNGLVQYHTTDEQPPSGINYYRLKQLHHDGSWAYSKTIAVQTDNANGLVYPNPMNGSNDIFVQIPNAREALIVLQNTMGQSITCSQDIIASDKIQLRPQKDLAQGLYIINIQKNNTIQRLKLVVN